MSGISPRSDNKGDDHDHKINEKRIKEIKKIKKLDSPTLPA